MDTEQLVNLIYETAEEIELWPKLLDACKKELLEIDNISIPLSSSSHSSDPPVRQDERLLTHLQRAFRLNSRVAEMAEEVGAARKVLDHLPMAVITINRSARIMEKNQLAEKVLASSGILCEINGTLRAGSNNNTVLLDSFINNAFSTHAVSQANHSLKLETKEARGSISIFAVPPLENDKETFCTFLIVTNLWSQQALPQHIQERYKLTPAETRLTHMLVAGNSLNDISARLTLSQNTVRNQLKSVFAKTGTHRQAELVSLVLSTPVQADVRDHTGNTVNKPESETSSPEAEIFLRDGRVLHYDIFGDPEGLPVFYIHDSVAWDWWNLIPAGELAGMGIKLIVPFRPGYGNSTFKSSKSYQLLADDLAELADYLRVDSFYLMGFSSGGAYATACAYYLRERCRALALVSSFAPIESLDDMANIRPAMSRMILGFAKAAPDLYSLFFRSLLRTVRSDPLNYLKRYISRWSPYDREKISQDPILASINKCLFKITHNGLPGLANESVMLCRPWGFNPSRIEVPVFLWRGDEDRASPANIAEKFFQIPNHHVFRQAGGGHLIILDVWQEVFSTMLQVNFTSAGVAGTETFKHAMVL